MKRVEEAQALVDTLDNMSKQLDPETLTKIAIAPLLCDIAMSLAVIADGLTGGKEENET